jgi:hypothetical protein
MGSLPRDWGITAAERALPLGCDGLASECWTTYHRAVDVRAPVEVVFRWLCQLRVAPYSYDWIDNGGRRSPRRLIPGLEELSVGQRFMTIFTLVAFEPGRSLTLRMHRGRGLFGDVVVTYAALAAGVRQSRLVMRLHVRHPGPGPLARAHAVLLGWGDLVMARKQLLTLRALAQETSARSLPSDSSAAC